MLHVGDISSVTTWFVDATEWRDLLKYLFLMLDNVFDKTITEFKF